MYALNLNEAVDAHGAGGKAANLARTIALGIRVPPGFVILQESLKLFLVTADLYWDVRHYLQDINPQKLDAARRKYNELCASVQAAPIPRLIRDEIDPLAEKWLAKAPAGLAVRSSGVNEDLPGASFAGIYESFLGVSSLAELWGKVVRVWCSAWSPRAVQYARKMGITLLPEQMAVIVQALVPAERSGVIFTADPLNGNPWRFVLNATYGLAQKLVDGHAAADRYVLAWDSGKILEKEIPAKPTAITCTAGGITETPLPAEQQTAAVLNDELAGKIGQIALNVDRAFDRRMDIEWAEAGGQIYLVQARPITALPVFFPHELSGAEAEQTWTPEDPVWHASIDQDKYQVTPLFRSRWALELWERRNQPNDIFPHKRGSEGDFNGFRYTTAWEWFNHGHDLNSTETWLEMHEEPLRKEWLAQLERVRQANHQAAGLQASAQRAKELIPGLLDFIKKEDEMQAAVWHAAQWLVFTCEALLKSFLEQNAASTTVGDLLQGLPCYSSERTAAAQDLGRAIHEDFVRDVFNQEPLSQVIPRLVKEYPGCQFLKEYEAFCWEFGIDPPSLPAPFNKSGQDPAQILFMIKRSGMQDGQDARAVLQACSRQRTMCEDQVRQKLAQIRPTRIEQFNKLLTWAQFWVPTLDDRKWHVAMSIRLASMLFQTGSLLTSEGLLDKAGDIRLLTQEDLARIAEVEDAANYRQLYTMRKHDYETNRRLTPPPFLGKPLEEKKKAELVDKTPPVGEREKQVILKRSRKTDDVEIASSQSLLAMTYEEGSSPQSSPADDVEIASSQSLLAMTDKE